ncbi:hypothetical protein [Jannaschia sp. R86511]|uniref:hypothetical protein n=1 Tax=Jannaschia sp. R86511 TaxID=3093853 RepID=UPI0036D3E90F
MTTPYDDEALWMKAKLFVSRAMEGEFDRSFDEQALWASLALELLAKAALARQSPLLIAVPTEDGSNVLIALGLTSGVARFESVSAKTLYSRCERAFRPFSKPEADKITFARNEYLHGSTPGFTLMPPAAWWPKFWALAVILVGACDKEIDDLVGPSRLAVVNKHLEQNKKNVEHRTEMLLDRARQRRAQFEAGTLPAKVASQWKPGQLLTAGLKHSGNAGCPACGRDGVIEGNEVTDVETEYLQIAENDYDVLVSLTVESEYFSCASCGLVLDEYELLMEAEVPSDFRTDGDSGDIDREEEYGND